MKKWQLWAMIDILSAIICLATSGVAYSAGTMTDLGTLPGGSYSRANGINDSGQIVGYSTSSYLLGEHAFIYSGGKMADLGPGLSGQSWAYGINGRGQVVGSFIIYTPEHAFLYSGEVMTDLGTLGGIVSRATGINDNGQIVGYANNAYGGTDGFLYSGGQMTALPSVDFALGINNSGQIVGYKKYFSGSTRAILYSGDQTTDLGTLGGTSSWAVGINDSGQIVGCSDTASGDTHAFLYSKGQMIDLGTLPGGWNSYATGINNKGQIVGYADTASEETHAFLYNPTPPSPSSVLLLLLGSD